MESQLSELFNTYPGAVVVLKRGQTPDQLKVTGDAIAVTWEQAVDFLMEDFLSRDGETRNAAVLLARALAKQGNDCGVEAIERAIRQRHGKGECEFYKLSHARIRAVSEIEAAPAELPALASRSQLWKRPPIEVQRLIAMCGNNLVDLFKQIEERADDEQRMAFQLLATHLQLMAIFSASVGH